MLARLKFTVRSEVNVKCRAVATLDIQTMNVKCRLSCLHNIIIFACTKYIVNTQLIIIQNAKTLMSKSSGVCLAIVIAELTPNSFLSGVEKGSHCKNDKFVSILSPNGLNKTVFLFFQYCTTVSTNSYRSRVCRPNSCYCSKIRGPL